MKTVAVLILFGLLPNLNFEKPKMPSHWSIMGLKGEVKMMVSYAFAEEQKESDTSQAFMRIIRYFDRNGYETRHDYRMFPYWSTEGKRLTHTVNDYSIPNQFRWNEYDSTGKAVRSGLTKWVSEYRLQDSSIDLIGGQVFLTTTQLNTNYRETSYTLLLLDEHSDTIMHENAQYELKNGYPIVTYRHDLLNQINDTSDLVSLRFDSKGNPTETLIEWRNSSQSKRYFLRYYTYY